MHCTNRRSADHERCPARSGRTFSARRYLQQELQWQLESLDAFQAQMDETEQKLAVVCQMDQPWVDTIRTILEVVLGIPGISGRAFLRHDAQEHFVAEFFAGSYHQFWGLLQSGGRGVALAEMQFRFQRAWESGDI